MISRNDDDVTRIPSIGSALTVLYSKLHLLCDSRPCELALHVSMSHQGRLFHSGKDNYLILAFVRVQNLCKSALNNLEYAHVK